MYGHAPFCGLGDVEEFPEDVVWWDGPVREEQVVVVEAVIGA